MTHTTDSLRHAGSMGLSEVSALTKPEREHVRQWLTDNFCSEETFGWVLTELADGGLSLEDPSESESVDDRWTDICGIVERTLAASIAEFARFLE